MPDKTIPNSDVLQSDHHSTLSDEAIAKALARHNRDHKGEKKQDQAAQAQAKTKKAGK